MSAKLFVWPVGGIGWYLHSGEEYNRRYPDTFHLPPAV